MDAFQKKYMGTRYIEARRLEFIKLRQGDMTLVEYDVEFLRLSRYAPGMVAEEQDKCARFEFKALMEKAKNYEEVRHIKH